MNNNETKFPIVSTVVGGIITIIGLIMYEDAKPYAAVGGTTFPLMVLILGIIILAGALLLYSMKIASPNEYNKYKSDIAEKHRENVAKEQAEIEREKRAAIESQKNEAPWNKRYFTEPCPYCRHYKVRYSTWDDKKMSVAFWGVWSNKVGKSFHCDRCGRDFNN